MITCVFMCECVTCIHECGLICYALLALVRSTSRMISSCADGFHEKQQRQQEQRYLQNGGSSSVMMP